MSNHTLMSTTALFGALLISAFSAVHADDIKTRVQEQVQQQGSTPPPVQKRERVREYVYGYELMSPPERREMQMRMRNAKTVEERDRIRQENHERMMKRAQERGVELMDPGMPCGGMGPGMGPGSGMSPGMGPGTGPGRRGP